MKKVFLQEKRSDDRIIFSRFSHINLYMFRLVYKVMRSLSVQASNLRAFPEPADRLVVRLQRCCFSERRRGRFDFLK